MSSAHAVLRDSQTKFDACPYNPRYHAMRAALQALHDRETASTPGQSADQGAPIVLGSCGVGVNCGDVGQTAQTAAGGGAAAASAAAAGEPLLPPGTLAAMMLARAASVLADQPGGAPINGPTRAALRAPFTVNEAASGPDAPPAAASAAPGADALLLAAAGGSSSAASVAVPGGAAGAAAPPPLPANDVLRFCAAVAASGVARAPPHLDMPAPAAAPATLPAGLGSGKSGLSAGQASV